MPNHNYSEDKKEYFINVSRAKNRINHKIQINARQFNLDDIENWKHYASVFLEHMHYSCVINGKDFNEIIIEIFEQINRNNKQFKNRMGKVLGNNWSNF